MSVDPITRQCAHCAAQFTLYQVTLSATGLPRATPAGGTTDPPGIVVYVWAVSAADAVIAVNTAPGAPSHAVRICPAREYRELLEKATHER